MGLGIALVLYSTCLDFNAPEYYFNVAYVICTHLMLLKVVLMY